MVIEIDGRGEGGKEGGGVVERGRLSEGERER